MPIVAKGSTPPRLTSLIPPQGNMPIGIAAEDIENGDACRWTAAGAVRSVGDEDVDGFAVKAASAGQPITLLKGGERMKYGSGLAVGTNLYLDPATPGRLNTTAGGAGTRNAVRVARVVEPTVIQVYERHLA